MSVWDDPKFTAEVVRRYVAGEGSPSLALSLGLTRNQVTAKLNRLGVLRGKPSSMGKGGATQLSLGSSGDESDVAMRDAPRPHRPTQARGNAAGRASKLDPIRRAFASGQKTIADLVEMTDYTTYEVSGLIRRLVDMGEVERLPYRGRGGIYRRIRTPAPTMRGQDLRRMEDAYVQARKSGSTARDLAQSMNLTQTAAEKFGAMFRAQTTSSNSFDNSCPKFAHHDRHLSALARVGAYPVMPSRPGYKMAARP